MVPPAELAVSQFTTWSQSFEEDVRLYSRLGVRWIEVCERKLALDQSQARRQLAFLRSSGLRVSSVQPRVHALFPDTMAPDPADPRERVARFRQTIDLFADCFPNEPISLVAITGKAPGFDFAAAVQTACALYRGLADYAAERGFRIMLEPLNPILMNVDTFICTMRQALRAIAAVDRPNFGLMLDVWHVWDEPDLDRSIKEAGDRIFGVHVSDWRRDGPRRFADRAMPGDGVIDFGRILSAIHRSGYRGVYCVEIFSAKELPDSLWRRDPADLVATSRIAFDRLWAEAT